MTIGEVIAAITRAATAIYEEREAKQIARFLVMEIGGYTPTQLIVDTHKECEIDNLDSILEQITAGRPLQYIVGGCEFRHITLRLKEGVLIPRPETEELVEWIVSDYKGLKPSIIDVGTGSGVIAISLAKELDGSRVCGVDISTEAIAQAQANSTMNGTSVEFKQGDALRGIEEVMQGCKVDVIVSNPPYIPRSEAAAMRVNVVGYEPHLALFVDDDNPIIFYERIATSALVLLNEGGRLYFELHEDFASQVGNMLLELGYKNIECREDVNQKPRMICAQR